MGLWPGSKCWRVSLALKPGRWMSIRPSWSSASLTILSTSALVLTSARIHCTPFGRSQPSLLRAQVSTRVRQTLRRLPAQCRGCRWSPRRSCRRGSDASQPHLLDLGSETAVQHPELSGSIAGFISSKPVDEVGDIVGRSVAPQRVYPPHFVPEAFDITT